MLDEHPKTGFSWPEFPVLLAFVLAVAMTWPLVLHLGGHVNTDLGDPLFETWQLGWIGHALVHEPLHLYQSNRFWPEHDSLAFTDVMVGFAPAGLIAQTGPHAALVVHGLLFIFSYALAFLGAYLLASELGAGRLGAIVAGVAYAYAPWRLAQSGHLQVLSSGGIPLALFLLVRGYRRGSWRTVLAGWLVAAWQMTLGFTLGLQFAYLLLSVGAVVVVLWLQRGRPQVDRAVLGASAAGACVFVVGTAFLAQPYLRVKHAHPEAKRTPAQVAFFSPPARAFLVAPSGNLIWGDATAHRRNGLAAPVEKTLFPGVTVVVLALLGLLGGTYGAGLRIWLAAGTVVFGVLSLGLPSGGNPQGVTPYRFLYDQAPGWNAIRTPGRLNTLTSLGLALLAAAGVAFVLTQVRRHRLARRYGEPACVLVAGAFAALVLLEGAGSVPHPAVPPVPRGQLAAPAPQFHLPSDDFFDDGIYSYWSVDGFPSIVNGAASFNVNNLVRTRQVATTFPDAQSVKYLRQLGVRSVILHRDLAAGTPWENTADQSLAGLGITRQDDGELVIYRLGP
jgi:hypothetical protein